MNGYSVLICVALLNAAMLSPTAAGETRSGAAAEPTVTQTRVHAPRGHLEKEASITQAPAFERALPEDDQRSVRTPRVSGLPEDGDKELIRAPGPASGIELVPEDAESRCRRGEAHCTSRR
jgi:hypothetical protein